ncbi:unnamed protein product [Pedinophyceae sp. YPF-701]|nr:unnamed protein product [Pedinophyceae sp. YPF-701]
MGFLGKQGYVHRDEAGNEIVSPWQMGQRCPPDARVFIFRKGFSAGTIKMKQLLGGKGAGLCEMARIGVNVPPGFTITTEVCEQFQQAGKVPEAVWRDVAHAMAELEDEMGMKFGDPSNPLLLSVRSGAALSMPGMMNTVLNLGLNDEVVQGLAKKYGERFAWDCYRRFIDMYADVVLDVSHDLFEEALQGVKEAKGVKQDVDLSADDLKEVVAAFKGVCDRAGAQVPTDPWEQLKRATGAVFSSWMVPRAIKYREINKITGLKGTAVNIVSMVYGNLNDNSCTGVCFTRNPATGEKGLYGEFLVNAQGEDVVAGIRTPINTKFMADNFPEAYQDLLDNTTRLEKYMHDMQDCEFTVQNGRLFMLQTRNGKRTGAAAIKIAVDMVDEGMINRQQAVCMVEAKHLDMLLHPQFKDVKAYAKDVVAAGLAASPGAAVGQVVFSAEDAEAAHAEGRQVILVRVETVADDVGGMHAAEGILTARGGMTSHAAVVARGWGKPCVCGCEQIQINAKAKTFTTTSGAELKEGDWISINGTTGEVVKGRQEVVPPTLSGDVARVMDWVEENRKLDVLTNADTPNDARVARDNGAVGIGLCRTEHMFFASAQRIHDMRRMIVCEQLEEAAHLKDDALARLKRYQVEDFEGLFKAMNGYEVTVRLLDPPLHEFIPKEGAELDQLVADLSKEMHVDPVKCKNRILELFEVNPMLGLRGCRLGIVHPEITEMQAEAILEAACNVRAKGHSPVAHIMVPLVGTPEELAHQLAVVRAAGERVFAAKGVRVPFKVGTMIEIPRACLIADVLAKQADFFSFGTNDLTQMTFGYSRDDAAKFLKNYVTGGILPRDPFESIDRTGVGALIRMAVEKARQANPNIELGICGEHGGDPDSVALFHELGFNYVSCSPLRVPIARLAAAQANIVGASKQSE